MVIISASDIALDLRAFYANDPEKWCKKVHARDRRGASCHPLFQFARQWDLHGAMCKVYGVYGYSNDLWRELRSGICAVENNAYSITISDWNDAQTFTTLMHTLRKVAYHVPNQNEPVLLSSA